MKIKSVLLFLVVLVNTTFMAQVQASQLNGFDLVNEHAAGHHGHGHHSRPIKKP